MIYLNVAGLSPFNQSVQQEITTTLEQFSRLLYSDEGIHFYRETVQRTRNILAQWLQVSDTERIAFVPNATTANWIVLSRIQWRPDDHVLTTTHENSTVLKEISALRRQGVHVHTLNPSSPIELETEIQQLLKSTRVRAIVISHVSHIDGRIFPIERLHQLTQNHQTLLIVDGAQAVGHIPVTFQDWQPDAYFFPGHKWCAGPMGSGALILEKKFSKLVAMGNDETSQPLWADFELGTQNIGSVAGFGTACKIKQQEGMDALINEGIRAEWKTCLQEHKDLQISQWDGPHSPGILSFVCLGAETEQFLHTVASTYSLSWKYFNHPSFPGKSSIRVSWSMHTPKSDLAKALNCLQPGAQSQHPPHKTCQEISDQ